MKTAIILLSDPQAGTEESLGRLFNGLAAAYDYREAGDEVTVLFQGTATRWPSVLSDSNHPAHGLYNAVKDRIAGVSCGCADVFGALQDAQTAGMDLIRDNPVPHTSGLPSLRRLQADGYTILTF